MLTTNELIKKLRESMDSEYIQQNDDKIITLLKIAAEKLEKLQQLADDMLGDHYVDYLDWYANRCRELEDELLNIRGDEDGDD